MSDVLASNLVSKLRAEVVVPYKDGYEPLRAPPSKLMTDAADEIERLTADFQQVHHNCIHARQVADKALELLGAVPRDLMPMSWCRIVDEAKELARSVPPIPVPETGCRTPTRFIWKSTGMHPDPNGSWVSWEDLPALKAAAKPHGYHPNVNAEDCQQCSPPKTPVTASAPAAPSPSHNPMGSALSTDTAAGADSRLTISRPPQ